jgi:hypothetical protein
LEGQQARRFCHTFEPRGGPPQLLRVEYGLA